MEIQSLSPQGAYAPVAGGTERESNRSQDAAVGESAGQPRPPVQARQLGIATHAYSAAGRPVEDEPERTGISILA